MTSNNNIVYIQPKKSTLYQTFRFYSLYGSRFCYQLFDAFTGLFKGKPHVRIIILGLDNSGKTTFLKALSGQSHLSTTPTIGFNIKYLASEKLKMQVWDIGGQKSIRSHWLNFYSNCDAIIFVVDSTDTKRFEEVTLQLFQLLTYDELAGKPILILANKQDLKSACSDEQLMEYLCTEKIWCRQWAIVACSAKTKEGLEEGLEWLLNQLER